MAYTPPTIEDAPSTVSPLSAANIKSWLNGVAAYTDTRIAEGEELAAFDPQAQPATYADGRAYRVINTSATAAFDPNTIPDLTGWFDADRVEHATYGRDTFNRANSSSTPGTADSGTAWTVDAGGMGIIAGEALYNVNTGTFARGAFDGGIADGVWEWWIDLHATSGDVLCILRYQNNTNYVSLQVRCTTTPSTILQLTKKVAGTDTGIGFLNTGTGLTVDAVVRIRVQAIGNVYRVWVDDVEKPAAGGTDAGSSLLNFTNIGAAFNTGDSGSRFLGVSATAVRPTDNAGISGWADLSATGGHGKQPTVANRPVFKENYLNGRGVALFDGTDDHMPTGTPGELKPGTMVALINPTNAATIRTVVGSGSAGGTSLRFTTANLMELVVTNVGNITAATKTSTMGSWQIVAATHEPDGTAVFYSSGFPNGASLANVAVTPGVLMTIGARQSGSEPFNGYIAELLTFDRVLRGDELRRITDGLAAKWGIVQPPKLAKPSVPIRLDRRLKGSNLHPSQAQFGMSSVPIWTAVWGSGYSQAWNESSVDAAYNAGANAFRAIGDLFGPPNGTMTQATYLTRVESLIDYCNSKGMLYYASGGDLRHMGTGVTLAQIKSLIVALAQMCASKPNVFAFELLQEVGTVYKGAPDQKMPEGLAVGFVRELSRAVRAVAPNMPIGVSDIGTYRGGLNPYRERMADTDRLRAIDAYVDYHDVHLYPPLTLADYEVTPITMATDKPLIIGEFGMSRASSTAPQRDTFFRNAGTMIQANQRIIGAFNWAARTDNYGFTNEAGAYVGSDIEPGFDTIPVTW